MITLISDESEQISRILEFLTYSGIDAESSYNGETDLFVLKVPGQQYRQASALLKIYMEQEPDTPDKDHEEAAVPVHTFVGSDDKYKDNASSAFAFLTVGALILLVLILCSCNVLALPLTFAKQPFMFLTLLFLAFAFLVIGILSLKKADTYKEKMKTEKALEADMIKWFLATYRKEQLDHIIEAGEGTLPRAEILCLKRLELIRSYLLREYPALEENHADAVSETIYQKIFEE